MEAIRKAIEHGNNLKQERGKSPYVFHVIFSNRHDSNAALIGHDYDIPVLTRDDRGFRKTRGKKFSELREEFDNETLRGLFPYECSAAALGGYMLFASSVIFNHFLSINVHPADLSIVDALGERIYTGDKAVKLALVKKEPQLRSTTHILDTLPDHGPILMRSSPLPINYPIDDDILDRMADSYQTALKQVGDWVIFPKTLEYIADGRYARDEKGELYFDGKPIPRGITPDRLIR